MSETPAFLDSGRPDVPDMVVPRGIVPFFLPRRPVRGRLVRLGPLADALLTRHDNPPLVTALTGQALALVAALASALKFRGSFSLQAKGDGPIGLLLADCTDTGALRGYARADQEKLAALLRAKPEPTAADLLGTGYFALTVDRGPDVDRYQGLVTITGDSLADMALHYFETSEQLRCFLRIACTLTPAGWRAGALILEKVAGEGGGKLADRGHAGRHADRCGTARRSSALGPADLAAVRQRRRRCRAAARACLWLPLLPPTAVRDSGRLWRRRSGPHGQRRRHRDDLRILQSGFPLRSPGRARQGRRRGEATLTAPAGLRRFAPHPLQKGTAR